MPQVNITHDDSSTESISQTAGWKYRRESGEMWRLEIVVDRGDAQSVSLEKRSDEVELDGVATGRLVDVRTGGATWRLIVRSFEWDAKQVEPLSGGTLKSGDDQSIVTDLVNDVPEWSVGSIASLTGPMEFVFNHAFRHEALRRVERNVPGELAFRSDKSVDYVESRGTTDTVIETVSFSDTGESGQSVDVSLFDTVEVELWGPGGGDTDDADGGTGGYLRAQVDVSGIDTLKTYPGEGGGRPDAGVGLYDGGSGSTISNIPAEAISGGGGASSSLTTGGGTELAHADAGGGAADDDSDSGQTTSASGGGGARGGESGDISGSDAEGSGFGGDGGDSFEEPAEPGEDGGQEAVDSRVTVLDEQAGGGNDGDGEISYTTVGTILSPSAGNLIGNIKIKDKGLDLDATHLRVIGAHEGEAQKYATLVPAADTDSYANRVNYTNPDWSDGDAVTWARWENKDVTSQDTIEEEAAALAPELNREYVEAKATVEGEDLGLGDWVRVRKPKAGLDRDMRIVRITTKTLDDSPAATVDEVLLSTRSTLRESPASQRMDVQRFNVGFQGSSVIVQGGGGRQPVSGSVAARESFRYPPVDYEHEAVVEVKGLPYRAYSQGAADNADFGQVTEESSDLGEVSLTSTSTWEDFENPAGDPINHAFTEPTSVAWGQIQYRVDRLYLDGNQDETLVTLDFRLRNNDTGEYYPSSTGSRVYTSSARSDGSRRNNGVVPLFAPVDVNGETLTPEVKLSTSFSATTVEANVSAETHFIGEGKHVHEPDPGVIESFPSHAQANAQGELLPSGVDLIVNGSTVASDIGSGEFETTVDVSSALNSDSWNTIDATSDSLGHIKLTPYLEAYKQIGKR